MRSRLSGRPLVAAALLPLALPLLLTGCGGTGAAALAGAGAHAGAPAGFTLPPPTGPRAAGTTELHLVDAGRPDPWVPGRDRELMISVWYPVQRTGHDPGRGAGHRAAPYVRPGVARAFTEVDALGVFEAGTVDWAGARTHAAESAPADSRRGERPVVLYSPGFGVPRALGTTIAEELVSRGYVVVTMDHTGETPVEFPGGRVEPARLPEQTPDRIKVALDARVKDTRLVLDALAELDRGGNPDAERRRLPRGLGRTLDLSRVGMVGHSAGGTQAAETMRVDRRIDAGIDMDGTMRYSEGDLVPVAAEGLARPFMLMGSAPDGEPQTHLTNPSWGAFWRNSTGWKRDLNVPTARHYSYTDVQAFLPELDERIDIPDEGRTGLIGTVDPERMTASVRAYVTAFFDRSLRDRNRPILDRPSKRFPHVRFIR
ncbi:lipase [Actinomadura sp. WMMB 499]|uniref:alpha/beta hydrolase family protein n=1 Tax=Actinomadura sp. WMMB 499 TaxID=1219491 RepID=UPI0012472796|nr:lipase [Actinomadura sp. WMMB 499]QFG20522.1 lipase [Actinomadura sp. WMMB 499]